MFNQAKGPYQEALNKSGYKHELKFEKIPHTDEPRKNRKRKVIYFNPPWSKYVKTKVGKRFLAIIDKCFPVGHSLRKIFNRNTVKLSYSCLPNMGQAISRHNSKILKQGLRESNLNSKCNCRQGPGTCPLNGNCQNTNVIYRAGVTTDDDGHSEYYTGLTSRTFKKRLYEHTTDRNSAARRHNTSLSEHVWSLKDDDRTFSTTWTIMDRAPPFNPLTKHADYV